MITVIGDIDLTGDDVESRVAVRLRALGATITVGGAEEGLQDGGSHMRVGLFEVPMPSNSPRWAKPSW